MALAAGTRLGPYDIVAAIGEGGMGQVYRATDTKLKRQVAIKVLPPSLAADGDRLARFQREAEVLAALNHPHIAGIYGLEESNGVTALVMELLDGDDLSHRIGRGAIPIDDALPIAKQIAEALEAAHEQGIIHRDLKPANIKVKDDGTVKVLDFGLAKALDSVARDFSPANDGALNSPTLTAHATQMGIILGTAAYMSPEQAKGKPVDRRADIWAFGAVLYEMLTGRRAFHGEDISDTLAAVLRQDVDWAALPDATPPAVRHLIARCLERDVKRRLRDIGEARIVLEHPDDAASQTAGPGAAAGREPVQPMWRRALPFAAVALVASALGALATWTMRPTAPLTVTRFSVELPAGQTFTGAGRNVLALSSDGTQIAYVAANRLHVRSMSDLSTNAIQGTQGFLGISSPVFSPDGQSVAFFATATLKRIPVGGGVPVTICAATNPFGIEWTEHGIVFGQGEKGIMRVSPDGGTPEVIASVNEGELAHGPHVLPGGNHLLFTVASASGNDRWDKARIVVESLRSHERKTIIEPGSDALYISTGHIVYAVAGVLYATAFDLGQLASRGGPVPIVEGVRRGGLYTGTSQVAWSNNGALAYVPGELIPVGQARVGIALIDRKGSVEPLPLPPGTYAMPRVSPDGSRVAFHTDDGKEAIVWGYDLSGKNAMVRLTYEGNNRRVIWSRDGKGVAYQSDRQGDHAIFWQSADASGRAERLTKPENGVSHFPEDWSPTEDVFLFTGSTAGARPEFSLWSFSLRNRSVTRFGTTTSSAPMGPVFSPDGRWVAYSVTRGIETKAYIEPFPPTGMKYQLVGSEGENPHHLVWSPDGSELFYVARAGGFDVVRVTTVPAFAFGVPTSLPRPFESGPASVPRPYDMSPSGKIVGVVLPGMEGSSATPAQSFIVVLNWQEELKRRLRPN